MSPLSKGSEPYIFPPGSWQGAHFAASAALMRRMSEDYRALYTHMAEGSSALCEDTADNPQLAEFRRLDAAPAVPPTASAPAVAHDPAAAARQA